MSEQYNLYLAEHIANVQRGLDWIQGNLPELVPVGVNLTNFIEHDASKYCTEEYEPYNLYFYGEGEKTQEVKEMFDMAWLHHIHNNPHHWQHWILFEDEGGANKPKALQMPLRFIFEMICDWWAFSWKSGNLYEMFDWYKDHESKMLLHPETKKHVDYILDQIEEKLTELDKQEGIGIETETE